MDQVNLLAKFDVCRYTRSWDNNDGVLGGGCKHLVKRRPYGVVAFVLQHATFPYPTSSLSQFPHVPLRVGGWPLGSKDQWS